MPDEAVLNRIRARRKLGRKLLVVEGQTDVDFVEQYLNLNPDVHVEISKGKTNAIQAMEELGLEKEVLALVDWDYEWLGADSLVYPRPHMCAYDGHSLESFKFFFWKAVSSRDRYNLCSLVGNSTGFQPPGRREY